MAEGKSREARIEEALKKQAEKTKNLNKQLAKVKQERYTKAGKDLERYFKQHWNGVAVKEINDIRDKVLKVPQPAPNEKGA